MATLKNWLAWSMQIVDLTLFSPLTMLEYCWEMYTYHEVTPTLHHKQTTEFVPDSNTDDLFPKIHFQETVPHQGHHLS